MVYFRYYEPVAFVLSEAPTSWRDTFSGVIVVREYLAREFSKRRLPADIRVIGPTPLHADSCVQASDIDNRFDLVRVPSKGMTISRSSTLPTDFHRQQWRSDAFRHHYDELSLYYSLVSARSDRGREGAEISILTQNLMDIYQAKGFRR